MNGTALIPQTPLSTWQRLDRRLFAWVGGGHQARPLWLALACATGRWSWLPLLGLMLAGLWREGAAGAWVLVQCLGVATAVQLASKRLARLWQAQRPFMLGLSPNHLQHSARAGFPSTHATVMGAVLGVMAWPLQDHPALPGMVATVLATGWARVYAGAHFPLDIAAGWAAGVASGGLIGWWLWG